MSDKTDAERAAEGRRARQEEQLRANLKRRKEQARARRDLGPAASEEATEADAEPGGPATGTGSAGG